VTLRPADTDAPDLRLEPDRRSRSTVWPLANIDARAHDPRVSIVSRTLVAVGRLLEREDAFAALYGAHSEARAGTGRLTFVAGEAGVGKTSLVRAFCEGVRSSSRVLEGACDPLFTPRPLGPFADIAVETRGPLAELLDEGGTTRAVHDALQRELDSISTVLVLEDLHWADEATLDVVRMLGRRIEGAPALVIASYRDDELDRAHPLRIVLGELATAPGVGRLRLEPLSPSAVARLAEGSQIDAGELYRKTSGNPFYVREVLDAGGDAIPPTVREAVLARTARLSPAAEAIVEAVAVAPPHLEPWLLGRVCDDAVAWLEDCLSVGVLVSVDAGVAFRHELARIAVEEQLNPARRLELHRRILAALSDPPAGPLDLARLAHHAEKAGDHQAVLRFAPDAAAEAAALGAHREAAAQYARALRFSEGMPEDEKAELLERHSFECFLTDQILGAIGSLQRAREAYRELGDRRKEGAALSSLARRLWCAGRTEEFEAAVWESVALLEGLPPGRELAMAYGLASATSMSVEDADGAIAWGSRASELAHRLDDTDTLVYALNNVGTAKLLRGDLSGRLELEESLELAKRFGLEDHAGRAYLHLAWALCRNRAYDFEPLLEEGIEYCSDHGLDLWWLYLLTYRARAALDRGRWDEAADAAAFVVRTPRESPLLRTQALVVLGLIRARRGDPEVWPPLNEALALAEASGELQAIFEVAPARAEAAWLQGNDEAAVQATDAAFGLALAKDAPWILGSLASWRRRAGVQERIPLAAAAPYALELAGEAKEAAASWAALGCPYEAALALADADDEDALRRALEELDRVGARPAAAIVARRLRARGTLDVPRGPRPSTRANPAGLTAREAEVLRLVAEGLRNAEIAQRLFVSRKTVEHHVSAILRKLDARTRGEAVAAGTRLGVLQDR
jgi:DNA-binding CsgD family transcriptional regulator